MRRSGGSDSSDWPINNSADNARDSKGELDQRGKVPKGWASHGNFYSAVAITTRFPEPHVRASIICMQHDGLAFLFRPAWNPCPRHHTEKAFVLATTMIEGAGNVNGHKYKRGQCQRHMRDVERVMQ